MTTVSKVCMGAECMRTAKTSVRYNAGCQASSNANTRARGNRASLYAPMISRDKALSKQILSYHRVPTPGFAVLPVRVSSSTCPPPSAARQRMAPQLATVPASRTTMVTTIENPTVESLSGS